MNNMLLKLYVMSQTLMHSEEGQDLIEYALLVTLIALACITSIGYVTTAIETVFTSVSTALT